MKPATTGTGLRCPVKDCRSAKAGWHLTCGKHWAMVPQDTQRRYIDLYKRGKGSDQLKQLASAIVGRLNGESSTAPSGSVAPGPLLLYTQADFDMAGAWDEVQTELPRFRTAYRNRLEIEGSALEAVTSAFAKGFAQGYLHAKQRYDVAPAEEEGA